jgi:intracellular sulfur oxidation DsrE/DsrF family protein
LGDNQLSDFSQGLAMRRTFLKAMLAMLPSLAIGAGFSVSASAAEPIKVVYHLVEGIDQASRALGNIRNHLRAEPESKIVVVANGDGIKFLLADAAVSALAAQGVEFKLCSNTLAAHEIPLSQVIPEVKLVQSGVVEVARLQAREGFVYIRP